MSDKFAHSYFNCDDISIERVENGYIVKGRFNFSHCTILCRDFGELVTLLWKSYHTTKVGAECPWGDMSNTKEEEDK